MLPSLIQLWYLCESSQPATCILFIHRLHFRHSTPSVHTQRFRRYRGLVSQPPGTCDSNPPCTVPWFVRLAAAPIHSIMIDARDPLPRASVYPVPRKWSQDTGGTVSRILTERQHWVDPSLSFNGSMTEVAMSYGRRSGTVPRDRGCDEGFVIP